MTQDYERAMAAAAETQQGMMAMMGRLLEAARPEAAFSAPITAGGQTLITSSEVGVGFGAGFGSGMGSPETTAGAGGGGPSAGGGGGSGGFGGSRPVAVISAGPEGVHIQPIFDATKIALALFTAVGTMVVMLARMRRS